MPTAARHWPRLHRSGGTTGHRYRAFAHCVGYPGTRGPPRGPDRLGCGEFWCGWPARIFLNTVGPAGWTQSPPGEAKRVTRGGPSRPGATGRAGPAARGYARRYRTNGLSPPATCACWGRGSRRAALPPMFRIREGAVTKPPCPLMLLLMLCRAPWPLFPVWMFRAWRNLSSRRAAGDRGGRTSSR